MRNYYRMAIMGADTYGPDADFTGPMTPEQLANLDRKLTPAEQKAVDDYQSAQAKKVQASEESKPFINPETGKKTVVQITDLPDDDNSKWWYLGLGALALGALALLTGR